MIERSHPWRHNWLARPFIRKEEYGEIVNDLSKVDQPYAKVLRVTKRKMMMEDGQRNLSLPSYLGSKLPRPNGGGYLTDEYHDGFGSTYELEDSAKIALLKTVNAFMIARNRILLEKQGEIFRAYILRRYGRMIQDAAKHYMQSQYEQSRKAD